MLLLFLNHGMRYGRIHKIPTMFIDLPYSEILIASKQGSRLLKQDVITEIR